MDTLACDWHYMYIVEQNTMGRYPANTVAANIKDHYTAFAPLLKKSRCIWDITDNLSILRDSTDWCVSN